MGPPAANQYDVRIRDANSGSIISALSTDWKPAGFFGCSSSDPCSYTTSTDLPPGEYVSEIRSRNSNVNICTQSGWAVLPTPVTVSVCQGSIRARAVLVPYNTATCSVIKDSPNLPYLPGSSIDLGITSNPTSASQPTLTQPANDGNYQVWSSVDTGVQYTLSSIPSDSQYQLQTYCHESDQRSVGSYFSGATMNWPALQMNEIITWDVGYSFAQPWLQARGGSVHSNQNIDVSLPQNEDFLIPEPGVDNSGIASYVGSANFGSFVSSELDAIDSGYIADENSAHAKISNYYQYYLDRFDPTTMSTIASGAVKPSVNGVYRSTTSDFTLSSSWSVLNGESYIIFVPNSLTVSATVTVENGGFVAFIVGSGGISIGANLGYSPPLTSSSIPNRFTSPNIAGIFITDGTFVTQTTGGTDRQLIGAGTFVADGFNFNRDLELYNGQNPGELFVYRADLWRNAPEELKEIQITWQEVAP